MPLQLDVKVKPDAHGNLIVSFNRKALLAVPVQRLIAETVSTTPPSGERDPSDRVRPESSR